MPLRKLVAGNWKMNGVGADVEELRALSVGLREATGACDVLVCPPATLLHAAAGLGEGAGFALGAQDCSAHAPGAHTGDLSASMLRDAGARWVILGHSERRADHGETDEAVAAKARAALAAGLTPVVCVGETHAERAAGRAEIVVRRQVAESLPPELEGTPFALAYEPVWAIGTGETPTTDEVSAMHGAIRQALRDAVGATEVRILYGGSVKPANAAELLHADGVDGALVGGASLKAADFLRIIRAAG